MKRRIVAFAMPLCAAVLSLLFFSSPAHAQGQVYQPGDVSSVQLSGPYSPAATCLKGACAFTLGDQPQAVSTTSSPITDQALNSNTNVVLFTGAATLTVNSFAGPVNGRVIEVINNTGNTLTFAHDTGATTANRIYTTSGASQTLADRGVALLVYSTTDSRWHLFSASGSSFTLATGEVVQVNSGTSTVTDYAVNSTTTVIKFTGAASFSITGFTGGVDGRVLKLVNATGNGQNFLHDTISTTANRIYTSSGAAEAWPVNAVKYLIYSGTANRWILEATPTNTTYTATSPLALVGTAFGVTNGDRGDIVTTTGTQTGDTWTIDTGVVNSAKIADGSVALADMVNLADSTVIGRASGAGTGVPQALTTAQLTALVNPVNTVNSGAVSALPSDATKFFDGTGNWSKPASGGAVPESVSTTGTINDYTMGSTTTTLFFTGAAPITLNGIAGGADGRCITIVNSTSGNNNITINNQNAGSLAANRFTTWGGVSPIVAQASAIVACYEAADTTWRVNEDGIFGSITDTGGLTVSGTSSLATTTLNNAAAHASTFTTTNVDVEPGSNAGTLSLGTNSSATGGVNIGASGNPTNINGTATIAGTTALNGAGNVANDFQIKHHFTDAGGTLPTLSSCGTSSRTGGEWSWTITPGAVNACTITFATACSNTPTCVATSNYNTTAVNYFTSKSASAVTLNVTGTGWSGAQSVDVICICH